MLTKSEHSCRVALYVHRETIRRLEVQKCFKAHLTKIVHFSLDNDAPYNDHADKKISTLPAKDWKVTGRLSMSKALRVSKPWTGAVLFQDCPIVTVVTFRIARVSLMDAGPFTGTHY